jgi:hypothetical protein
MKTLITIMTVVVLSLAVTAFADEPVFMAPPDTGTLFSQNLPGPMPGVTIAADRPLADVGVELYISHKAGFAVPGATGVAAGGKAGIDEKTRIWDDLLAPSLSAE